MHREGLAGGAGGKRRRRGRSPNIPGKSGNNRSGTGTASAAAGAGRTVPLPMLKRLVLRMLDRSPAPFVTEECMQRGRERPSLARARPARSRVPRYDRRGGDGRGEFKRRRDKQWNGRLGETYRRRNAMNGEQNMCKERANCKCPSCGVGTSKKARPCSGEPAPAPCTCGPGRSADGQTSLRSCTPSRPCPDGSCGQRPP